MPVPGLVRILDATLVVGAASVVAAAVAGLGADLSWRLALVEHLRAHLLVAAVAIAVLAALRRRTAVTDAALLAALLHVAIVLEVAWPGPLPAGPPLRIVSLNVHTESQAFARVARFIAASDADVVVLLEVDRAWLAALAIDAGAYPLRVEVPRDDNFGIAVYARRRGTAEVRDLEGLPTVVLHLDAVPERWTVIATHPTPPVGAAMAATQARQLASLAALARAPGPTVVVGDLNLTPWSRRLRRLREAAGLRDSRGAFAYHASWPSALGPLGIPIDHVLVSADVAVVERRVGPDVGSDHRGVIVDVAPGR